MKRTTIHGRTKSDTWNRRSKQVEAGDNNAKAIGLALLLISLGVLVVLSSVAMFGR